MRKHKGFVFLFTVIAWMNVSLWAWEHFGMMDLNGQWVMKDCALGKGISEKRHLPENWPSEHGIVCPVPGTVRNALLLAGRISDPYSGYENEKSLWVEEREWWFYRKFSFDSLKKDQWVDLIFEGSSFQGEVWLNGKEVGQLKGMLNPWSFSVNQFLRPGENFLAVRLEAPEDARRRKVVGGLTYDMARDQLYSIAQCMFGWDWAPHGVPIGLWQSVKLRITGPLRVDHPYIRTRLLSDGNARVEVSLDITNLSAKLKNAVLRVQLVEVENKPLSLGPIVAQDEKTLILKPASSQTVEWMFTVSNPTLWWPNGMGNQPLYGFRAVVQEEDKVSDSLCTRFGIREIRLVENEKIDAFLESMKAHLGSQYHLGKAFGAYPWTFEVNGKKMFAKGANWIPIDQLLRLDRFRYDHLLKLAKETHFNLLRVWGGGLYETDTFYELCDQYGILAWQEFLSNRNFSKIDRENFLQGAESAILRLRNHPSLVFWCGGNEFDPDDTGSKAVIDSLEAMLKRLDPSREFHRASPYMGDDHYWGVWHGGEPYTKYRVVRPFRSEAGVNTFPSLENYRKFTPDSLLWPPDPTFIEYHGEHNTQFHHLKKLLRYANEFGPSHSIEEFIRKSQLYQALAVAFNMEFCRSHKFQNSGLLIWQYNDIWPCISWSIVDWYGEPKPGYYFLKRASRPVHGAIDFERYLWKVGETFSADLVALNDTFSSLRDYRYYARILNVTGHVLAKTEGRFDLSENVSQKIGAIQYSIPETMRGRVFFLTLEILDAKRKYVSDVFYPIAVSQTGNIENYDSAFDELNKMPEGSLEIHVEDTTYFFNGQGPFRIECINTGSMVCFWIRFRLSHQEESVPCLYSDNYITLLPQQTRWIEVYPVKPIEKFPVTLEVSAWNCKPVQIKLK